MKTATLLVSLAAASGPVAAQDIQSNPFNLVIQSTNKTLHGQSFSTCHTGAAIESICLYKGSNATFHLNTTEGIQPGPGGMPGILTWELPSQPPIPSSMTLNTDPSTNVALPLFFPGDNNAQWVAFDQNNELNIVSYLDDTKSPPSGQLPRALKRWYVCNTYFTGYTYTTLSWVLGNGKPQNPSCVKVEVRRKFI
ncbi:hypothetical protein E4U55_001809 [Claviceps digitariae]|nr:hypothetical protein E4U55_001809 [Claviceps digitariae]